MLSELLVVVAACAAAIEATPYKPTAGWDLKSFKSFVTFGDSYTDENRLGYFGSHNGSAPPVGWVQPVGTATSSGGRIWARYVSDYTKANLYNYAVSGAVCSNAITPRTWSTINAPFPAVKEYEIPAFIADSKYSVNGTKILNIPQDETVYSIWIGTNDLGNDAFLTDSQVQGKTLIDYINCVYEAMDSLYANGARYFVLMNAAPLELLPQYSIANGGLAKTKFYPNKGSNITEIHYRMLEEVVTVNGLYEYKTPAEIVVNKRYPGAHAAVFDTYSFISDMYYHPAQYLNGTAPLNVTGVVNQCNLDFSGCVVNSSPDSFLWYDELHPSEQADRQIAKEFVNVVKGTSKWAKYWS